LFSTVIISIVRIRYLKLFEDFTWENVASSLWSIGELTSALTCACLPTLRPLMSRYFPAFGSQAGRSAQGYMYAKSGSGVRSGARNGAGAGPSALESGLGGSATVGRGRARSGKRSMDDGGDSITGSEVELACSKGGNPFEVHVVREVRMGVENGGVRRQTEMGVRGYISPARPERVRSKASRGF
jgi:hypothetical protein